MPERGWRVSYSDGDADNIDDDYDHGDGDNSMTAGLIPDGHAYVIRLIGQRQRVASHVITLLPW